MHRARLFSGLAGAIAIAGSVAAANPEQSLFDARYSVRLNGLKLGHMTRTLRVDATGLYTMTSNSQPSGVAAVFREERVEERTQWRMANDEIIPAAYLFQQSGGSKPRTVSVKFDWANKAIENSYNARTWRMAAIPGVLDKLLYQYALMRDLGAGKRSFRYAVADGGHIKDYVLEVTGEERIRGKLGEFDTLRITRLRSDKRRETVIWSAPALNFLPVRVDSKDQNGAVTSVTLDRLTGKPPASSDAQRDPVRSSSAASSAAGT